MSDIRKLIEYMKQETPASLRKAALVESDNNKRWALIEAAEEELEGFESISAVNDDTTSQVTDEEVILEEKILQEEHEDISKWLNG